MNTLQHYDHHLVTLKSWTYAVYVCQLLMFMLAGLPLLAGVAINFYKRPQVEGTWLESHFEWQIQTAWMALAGFAISGLLFAQGIGIFTLTATILLILYRIAAGWYALNSDKPIKDTLN
jgi:uncharacterized membrane protein